MLFISKLLILIALWFLNDEGQLTNKHIKRLLSVALLCVSCGICTAELGVMRGVFVFLALVSLLGTLGTLLIGISKRASG